MSKKRFNDHINEIQTFSKVSVNCIVYGFNKVILILILSPLLSFSQSTDFTPEQEALAQEVVNKIKTTPDEAIDFGQFIKDLNAALDEAPYHPDLLYQLFRVYAKGIKDFNFVSNYCERLDQTYLQNYQRLLVEFCTTCYFAEQNFDLLYSVIPIIKDKKNKDLYYALYYMETENYYKGEEYALTALKNDYKLQSSAILKAYLFELYIKYLASKQNRNRIYELMLAYKDQLESFNLDIDTHFVLIETAIINDNYKIAEDLIRYCGSSSFQNFRYMSIPKALLYSLKGDQDMATRFLETALNLDDSVFESVLNETDGFNVFSSYLKTVNNLSDYDTKVHLVTQMLDFFKGKSLFTLQTKLYQSVLLASKDAVQAQAILDSCKEVIHSQSYKSFKTLIQMENELYKEDPDYRLVDRKIENLKPALDERAFIELRLNYRSDVNIIKKSLYFNAEEMADGLDQFIKFIDDETQRRDLMLLKIETIALFDIESANAELDKLGLEESEKALFFEGINDTMDIDNSKTTTTKSVKGINGFNGLKATLIDIIMTIKVSIK
ncbi:hypothetical protein [Winogradskyella sp.]|uniref:hypothetical protein n=1 Tax=Winogradskyella sp. TaxID=1883156 RepID=UPI002626C19C|nr:hypothetical protein [Winogradskyella sp.]